MSALYVMLALDGATSARQMIVVGFFDFIRFVGATLGAVVLALAGSR